MLEIGKSLPEINSVTQKGDEVQLKNIIGKEGLIVFFYPKASTPGCTAEACNLSENYTKLNKELGFGIVGVSADSVKRQNNFSEKYGFPYPLLADESKEVINAFGVWGPKKFMGKEYDGIHRTTFVFDSEGVLIHRIDKVKTKDHTNQIIELLKK